jgi:hypothetical protein
MEWNGLAIVLLLRRGRGRWVTTNTVLGVLSLEPYTHTHTHNLGRVVAHSFGAASATRVLAI